MRAHYPNVLALIERADAAPQLLDAAYRRLDHAGGDLHVLMLSGLAGRGAAATVSVPGSVAEDKAFDWLLPVLRERPGHVSAHCHRTGRGAPLDRVRAIIEERGIECVMIGGDPIAPSKFGRWLSSLCGDMLSELSRSTHRWDLITVSATGDLAQR